ncbi:hypothetical protein P154DRAFT_530648 [Amniculicola lignicola CBS 123094]|uniref:Uncharacterized protein n=1 Tax=Amniculicola lignicola CBS 123094 TaxID=1392246 RepID=A0A6A5WWB8_9PLEO|nr:hypothetical protein P154DRAFT_530648 [Amniculicola lignicola CBS 123094]
MPHMNVRHGEPPGTSYHASKSSNRLVHSGGVHAIAAIVTPCQGDHAVLIHRELRCETDGWKTRPGIPIGNHAVARKRDWGSRDVPPGEEGFQSAFLDKRKHRRWLDIPEPLLPFEGQRPSRKKGGRGSHPWETWLPIVHMIRHRGPQAWHEYRPGCDSEVADTL